VQRFDVKKDDYKIFCKQFGDDENNDDENELRAEVIATNLKPDNAVRVEVDQDKLYEGIIQDDWEVVKPKICHRDR